MLERVRPAALVGGFLRSGQARQRTTRAGGSRRRAVVHRKRKRRSRLRARAFRGLDRPAPRLVHRTSRRSVGRLGPQGPRLVHRTTRRLHSRGRGDRWHHRHRGSARLQLSPPATSRGNDLGGNGELWKLIGRSRSRQRRLLVFWRGGFLRGRKRGFVDGNHRLSLPASSKLLCFPRGQARQNPRRRRARLQLGPPIGQGSRDAGQRGWQRRELVIRAGRVARLGQRRTGLPAPRELLALGGRQAGQAPRSGGRRDRPLRGAAGSVKRAGRLQTPPFAEELRSARGRRELGKRDAGRLARGTSVVRAPRLRGLL